MEEYLQIIGTALAAYLIGSFPTAYILVRSKSGKDLRGEGSGNIGTLNAFEVTRSRSIGVRVLIIDLLKGALPVMAVYLIGASMTHGSAALLGVVLGHNYSPWIGWKGGRGLAPAAGAALVLNPLIVLVWGLFWLAGFFRTRDVHFGNIAATVCMPLLILLVSTLISKGNLFSPTASYEVVVVAFILAVLVFIKHIEPLKELIRKRKSNQKNT